MKTEQFNQLSTINSIFTLCKVIDQCIYDLHNHVPERLADTVDSLQMTAQSYCIEATTYVNENKITYTAKDGIEIERAHIQLLECVAALKALSYALMIGIDNLHEMDVIPKEIDKPTKLVQLICTRFQDTLNICTDHITGIFIDSEENSK